MSRLPVKRLSKVHFFVELRHFANLAIFRGKHMLEHSVLQTPALIHI